MPELIETISTKQSRKLILLSQQIPPTNARGKAIDATMAAIEHLGYIQIDTISVIQRAHHHTLWNRNPRYKNAHLDQLVEDNKVYEYWSHAAAFLPMRDYRFSLPRKNEFKQGVIQHWYDRDHKLMKNVVDRITSEGPLMAKDFKHSGKTLAVWESKPTKRALESLVMQGELMIPRRKNFQKVYELTDRVLPAGVDRSMPTESEYARFLIKSYLRVNGLGQINEIIYLLKNVKTLVIDVAKEMLSSGELIKIKTADQLYYALPSSMELLNKRLTHNKLKILSPFDNLIIQRKRMKAFFGFDYLLECYVPKNKRRYGYFVLPLLWNAKLVGRLDCKADRSLSVFHIFHLYIDVKANEIESFAQALRLEIDQFMVFNTCQSVKLHKVLPTKYKALLQSRIEKNDKV